MSRVALIHWNPAEAEDHVERLRRAGHDVLCFSPQGAPGLRPVVDDPPDALVIDLDRIPSRARDIAIYLRQRQSTRRVPIVFAGGDPAKIADVRGRLPDATYIEWDRIASALRMAMEKPPVHPVVPGTMDSYVGTPVGKKLGIRADATVILLGAPAHIERSLAPLPKGVRLRRQGRGPARLILLFAKNHTELQRRFSTATRLLEERGALWIAWPKKSSGVRSSLSQQEVRAFGLGQGFVDFKICSIDDTWSGLCFTRRGQRR